jgi:hypothetical protein
MKIIVVSDDPINFLINFYEGTLGVSKMKGKIKTSNTSDFMEKTIAIRGTDITFSIWDLGSLSNKLIFSKKDQQVDKESLSTCFLSFATKLVRNLFLTILLC